VRPRGTVAAVFLAALLAAGAVAQTVLPEAFPVREPRFELGLLFGYQIEGNLTWPELTPYTSVDVQNTPTYGVTFGYNFGPSLEGEIQYSYARPTARAIARDPASPSPTFDLGVHQFQFIPQINFSPPRARVRPYLGVGVGFTLLNGSPTIDDTLQPSFSVSFGVKLYLAKTFGLRFEFRYAPSFLYTTGDGWELCLEDVCWNTGDRFLQQFDFRGGATFRF
jgi:Outer membrane protein beta-barrel domain